MDRKILKNNMLKKVICLILLFFFIMSNVNAQDTIETKKRIGMLFGTNIFGSADNNILRTTSNGGFFYSKKLSKKFSTYHELSINRRNFSKIKLDETIEGNYSVTNLSFCFAPEYHINKYMSALIGYGYNRNLNPKLEKTTGPIEIKKEIDNYDMLLFEYRLNYKDVVVGFRYDIGLNSHFKSIDYKIQSITVNMYLNLKKLSNLKK
jgi:hypothetical protein